MKFYQRFSNLNVGQDDARQRFTNRILYIIFPHYPVIQGNQLQMVSRALGETPKNVYDIKKILMNDFFRMLDMLERLYTRLQLENSPGNQLTASSLNTQITQELEDIDIDIGIKFLNGKFYPKGAQLLDDKLVNDPLDWLKNRGLSQIYEPFKKALNHLLRSHKDDRLLEDAVTDAYDALEALAKEVCNNDRKFDDNRELFISKIKTSKYFKDITKDLSKYAHLFRHGASKTKPKPKPTTTEVEAFIYIVGLLIRLGTETINITKSGNTNAV